MKVHMTKKGHERLRAELERLMRVERPKVMQAIAEARAHGDIAENAEFAAAKERQSFVETRILEIETKLAHAEIIVPADGKPDRVVFGVTVSLKVAETGRAVTYTLVGQDEADLKAGKISVQSPVGKALIGRREGETVTIQAPARTITYTVTAIRGPGPEDEG